MMFPLTLRGGQITIRLTMSVSLQLRRTMQALWLALALLLILPGSPALAAIHHGVKRDAKHEIEQLEEAWRSAQISGDLATLDRLMADDFIGISMTGQANTKQQQLDRYRTRTLVLTKIDLNDRKIKVVGNIAIVTTLAAVEGSNEGETMQGLYRYTRIYQRLPSGVWTTTNFEATRIPHHRQ